MEVRRSSSDASNLSCLRAALPLSRSRGTDATIRDPPAGFRTASTPCRAGTKVCGSRAPRQHRSRARFGTSSGSLLVHSLVGCCSLLSQFGSRQPVEEEKGMRTGLGLRPRSGVCASSKPRLHHAIPCPGVFTVDLRGLRAALTARAARDGVTESDVLRSALAAALEQDASASFSSRLPLGPLLIRRQTAKLSNSPELSVCTSPRSERPCRRPLTWRLSHALD